MLVVVISTATVSIAAERPDLDSPKIEWVLFAGALEDSTFTLRDRCLDLQLSLLDCEHDLWTARWDSTDDQVRGRVPWWLLPLALGLGVGGGLALAD